MSTFAFAETNDFPIALDRTSIDFSVDPTSIDKTSANPKVVAPSFVSFSYNMHAGSVYRSPQIFPPSGHRFNQPPIYMERAPSFTEDFYNRLWFLPNPVDFGYIIGATQRTFIIWNAYFVAMTCDGVVFSDTLQFSLTSGPTPPFTLPAIGQYEYVAEANAEGAFSFEVTSTWDFQTEDLIGMFVGNRIVLLDFEPLQQKGTIETLEWLTDIIQSFNGLEQRIQLRQLPRREFKFDFYLSNEDIQSQWDAMLFQWQKKAFGIPLWGEAEIHEATLTAGDTLITVDTTNASYVEDKLALIWQGKDKYESVQILTLTPTSITTAFPLTRTYTGRKFIIPVEAHQLADPPKNKFTADGHAHVSVHSMGIEYDDLSETWTWPDTYKTLPVFATASLNKDTLNTTTDGEMDMVDFRTGEFQYFSDTDFNREITEFRIRLTTKAAVWNFRKFLYYLRGSQKPVYIPSNKKDMVQITPVTAFGVSFLVKGPLLQRNYSVNDMKAHVFFHNIATGAYHYADIVSVSLDGSNSLMGIDGAGVPWATTNENTNIGWLNKSRLATDAVQMKWSHVGWVDCKLKFINVVD